MKRMIAVVLLAGGCGASMTEMVACPQAGCTPAIEPATEKERIRLRAAVDLRCPAQDLRIVSLGEDAFPHAIVSDRFPLRGAEGCGRRIAYLQVCDYYDYWGAHCRLDRLDEWLGANAAADPTRR